MFAYHLCTACAIEYKQQLMTYHVLCSKVPPIVHYYFITQLMDTTNCTQDNALFALHDSDNDVNAAVILLLESGNDMQVKTFILFFL